MIQVFISLAILGFVNAGVAADLVPNFKILDYRSFEKSILDSKADSVAKALDVLSKQIREIWIIFKGVCG